MKIDKINKYEPLDIFGKLTIFAAHTLGIDVMQDMLNEAVKDELITQDDATATMFFFKQIHSMEGGFYNE